MSETDDTLATLRLESSTCSTSPGLDVTGQGLTIFEKITRTICACLEQGVRPWVKPWASRSMGPHNIVTKHNYTGINVPLLWATQMLRGYTSDAWVTAHWLFSEGKEMGVRLRPMKGAAANGPTGQKAGMVVYYGTAKERREEAAAAPDEDRTYRFLKATNVFNLDQLDNVPDGWLEEITKPEDMQAPELARQFVEACDAEIKIGGDRACYSPLTDSIRIPHYHRFVEKVGIDAATTAYLGTLFHELTHWTGARHRLGRFTTAPDRTNADYAYEELIAEMGSAFLSAQFGLDSVVSSAAYLDHWLKVFRKDIKPLMKASADAQKAVEFLRNLQPKDPT